MNFAQALHAQFKIEPVHAQNIIDLLDQGNTIPFIARYRKEMHGALDDQVLREIADRLNYLRNLETRKQEVRSSILEQDKLTNELSDAIDAAKTLTEVEDIYRPFRPKRRTRATVAREKGLAPLAEVIFRQDILRGRVEDLAKDYVDQEKGILSCQDALSGASDIIAEDISDDAPVRQRLRGFLRRTGRLVTKAASDEDSVYSLYYEFSAPIKSLQSHQILAINRGEKEKYLKVNIYVEDSEALDIINRAFCRRGSITTEIVKEAAQDSWGRLLFPSIERELRSELTDAASEQAISMFALNLKPLLMQPPVRGKVTLGVDPAYRTGCKLAVVDGTGKVLETGVIYPTPPHNKIQEAAAAVKSLISRHKVTCIAIGNGTASGETERFIADIINETGDNLSYMVVNEAGASVYSASKLAAKEFPDYDVSIRSAVSIARRLQDPLAELVKIDPQSIGVGQYQHDMPQARLSQALGAVVEDCVNSVGVDLNTASAPLLEQVAGLTASISKSIVSFREENGPFKSRRALLKVPKLGPKTYEQCAGFLRVPESEQILDNTPVHPESYRAAETLLTLLGYTTEDVKCGGLGDINNRLEQLGIAEAASRCGIGQPTLLDIVSALSKPGRDPRDELPPPLMRKDVMDIKDLSPGMVLTGTVRNVIDFGAFVDIGVHQDGLVHISQLSDQYVRHPSQAVTVGDVVRVVVLKVEPEKKRISLSIKQVPKESI